MRFFHQNRDCIIIFIFYGEKIFRGFFINIIDTTTNNTITNNNQKFNLNLFLNTTCKDAMNMSEFIENMEVQFEDIENISRDGYVTGMTNMIMSRITPFHISNADYLR